MKSPHRSDTWNKFNRSQRIKRQANCTCFFISSIFRQMLFKVTLFLVGIPRPIRLGWRMGGMRPHTVSYDLPYSLPISPLGRPLVPIPWHPGRLPGHHSTSRQLGLPLCGWRTNTPPVHPWPWLGRHQAQVVTPMAEPVMLQEILSYLLHRFFPWGSCLTEERRPRLSSWCCRVSFWRWSAVMTTTSSRQQRKKLGS